MWDTGNEDWRTSDCYIWYALSRFCVKLLVFGSILIIKILCIPDSTNWIGISSLYLMTFPRIGLYDFRILTSIWNLRWLIRSLIPPMDDQL